MARQPGSGSFRPLQLILQLRYLPFQSLYCTSLSIAIKKTF